MTSKNYGFSLIELTVVIGIIGLLASIIEKVTLTSVSEPTAGGGTGVLKSATEGWNGSNKYFQYSN